MDKPAKRCLSHPEGDLILELTPEKRTYGRWLCSECSRFVVISRSPKVTDEMLSRQEKIRYIIREYSSIDIPGPCGDEPYLSDKDLKRMLYIYGNPRLGLLQEKYWREIEDKYA